MEGGVLPQPAGEEAGQVRHHPALRRGAGLPGCGGDGGDEFPVVAQGFGHFALPHHPALDLPRLQLQDGRLLRVLALAEGGLLPLVDEAAEADDEGGKEKESQSEQHAAQPLVRLGGGGRGGGRRGAQQHIEAEGGGEDEAEAFPGLHPGQQGGAVDEPLHQRIRTDDPEAGDGEVGETDAGCAGGHRCPIERLSRGPGQSRGSFGGYNVCKR